ncbi:pRL2-23 [Streptomyces sp. NPDC090442]|uniref:pRL2-23 n=1 Tax=Streptomyces sp. NPDC090442 TaxID=3365962 RepID=UPI003820CD2A
MATTLISTLGRLLGALIRVLGAERGRLHDVRQARRAEQVEAVTSLSVALADHRRAMWDRQNAVLTQAPDARVAELREELRQTRSAVAEPAAQVALLVPAVRTAAEAAVQATYAIRGARDLEDLKERRAAALAAHDRMVGEMARHLDAGLPAAARGRWEVAA